MLILTRRTGETVMIGNEVTLTVLGVKGNQVRIGINAPKNVPVHREEIYERIKRELSGGEVNGNVQEPSTPAPPARQRFHGHMPSTSTSSEKLRTIRMTMMSPRTATLSRVGSTMIVRTMSPMMSTSSPSMITRPRLWRRLWYAPERSAGRLTATT